MAHLLTTALAALAATAVVAGIAFLTDELRSRTVARAPSARAEAARMLTALTEAAARQPANAGPPIVVVPPPAVAPATTDRTHSRVIAVIAVLAALNIVQLVVHMAI